MSKGFFWPDRAVVLPYDGKKAKSYSCLSCGLFKKCNSPKMKVSGKGKRGIMFIGTAPNFSEDKKGKRTYSINI